MLMIDMLNDVVYFIENSGLLGVLIACILIVFESILPILPLLVFITINFLVLGKFLGFIISWVFTILGCIMSYYIFKKGFGNKFDRLVEDKEKLKKYKNLFKNITVGKLIIIISMPFTPAFMVNIVAGLVNMDFKKYFTALLFGKIALVYFWGFIGTSFVESIKNPIILIRIIIIMSLTYLLYLIVNKIFKLD